jgi:hypothetical protein
MPYTAPATIVTGTTITSAWGNSVKAATDYLANPPACRVFNSVAQAVANTTPTVATFNSERFDTNSMHDNVTNPTRITFATAGLYIVTYTGAMTAAADYSLAQAWIRKNGATLIAGTNNDPTSNVGEPWLNVTAIYKFAVADYVEAVVQQTNAAAATRNLLANLEYSNEFAAVWVGTG